MPTGYTSYIEDKTITNGKDFLLKCTRAFGVAVEIRDEPLDIPTPTEFKHSDYWETRYNDLQEKLNEYEKFDFEGWKNLKKSQYDKKLLSAKKQLSELEENDQLYNKIKSEIAKWNPPTREHIPLKNFALQQIDISMGSEAMYEILYKETNEPLDLGVAAVLKFKEYTMDDLKKDIDYAKHQLESSVRKAKENNRYMKQLIESLEETED